MQLKNVKSKELYPELNWSYAI